MRSSLFPIRTVGAVAVIVLLVLLLVPPVGAIPALQGGEPTARPTATPAPYVKLAPTQGIAGNQTAVQALGAFWTPGLPVTLYWDDPAVLLGTVTAAPDGTFQLEFVTPTAPPFGNPGIHVVYAEQGGYQFQAEFELLAPTPTNTPTSTSTPTPTLSPTPVSPTPTASPTPTLTPSPTLRPVTPMVTITPFPPTQPPPQKTAVPTRTRAALQGTPTATRTPTATPGPGTPTAVVQQATPTPVGEMAETGVGMGTIFLWGSVLAGLLVVFRLLRVRSLPG